MAPIQSSTPDNLNDRLGWVMFGLGIALCCVSLMHFFCYSRAISRANKYNAKLRILEQLNAETYTKNAVQRENFQKQLLHAHDELEQSKANAAELQKKVDELEEKAKAEAGKDDKPALCDICGTVRRFMENSPRQSKTDATSSRSLQATVVSAPTSPFRSTVVSAPISPLSTPVPHD
ncbi:hypothetical protein ACHAQK_003325 [Fusarium lateritium]